LRAGSKELLPAICENAVSLVSATPGMPLEDLLRLIEETITPDDIFTMIAAGILYVDLRAAALAEPSNVKVFATKETVLRSLSNVISTAKPLSVESLRCGSRISWDGRNWEVVNVGETAIGLLSDRNLTELPIAAFETLICENRAQMLPVEHDPDADRAIRERLSQASEADLQTATHRSGLISQYVESGVLPQATWLRPEPFSVGSASTAKPKRRTVLDLWDCCRNRPVAAIAQPSCRKHPGG